MQHTTYTSINQYIDDFPEDVASILQKIRSCVAETAPEAVECIAYNMPAFKWHNKPLIYFAAFKNHIGFYALPSGNIAFREKLTGYKSGKGSIQFPLNQDIPYTLISEIVAFRVMEVDAALKNKRG